MFEPAIVALGQLVDLDFAAPSQFRALNAQHKAVQCLRPPKQAEQAESVDRRQLAGMRVLTHLDKLELDWTDDLSDLTRRTDGLKALLRWLGG